ncbi:MAG: uroporphyrinogen decarboxylase family protein [Armatimonadota bacterium]|jgi:uroporphyrinogen decarboxylase
MTPRERVLAALSHSEPDRVPFDLGTTFVTGIHRIAYDNLTEAMGMVGLDEKPLLDPFQQLAMPHEQVLRELGVDTRSVYLKLPGRALENPSEDDRYFYSLDSWGLRRRMPKDGGLYYDMFEHPLAGMESVEEIDAYDWPDPLAGLDLDAIEAACRDIKASGDYPIIVGGFGSGMLELVLWLQGYDQGYMNLIVNKPVTEAILEHVVELKVRYAEAVLERVGPWVDVFYNGDDLGLQEGPMIRREWFGELLAPRYVTYHEAIKGAAPQARVFFHTCGSVVDLLPDLIETGIDILNPVQVNAAGMGDTALLKERFGDAVTFWGAIDTQQVMPGGSPQDVRDEVRRRIDDLAPGGGYVLNTSHNIQADVPPENILAMVEALDEFGWY